MARPKRGNYATGPEGQARYRKAVTAYLKKQKEAREKKTKITSTKKNIAKQKATNTKAATTTKAKATAKPKTTAKPKATTAKGQTLATGKTSKPKTTTATTTTTTRRKTTTKPKTTAKKPVAKKPVAKKPVAKKPTAKKPAGKVPARKPIISNKNKLRIKKAASTAADTTKKVVKKSVEQTKKVASNVKGKVEATRKALKKGKAPKPTTGPQKFVSKVTKGAKGYGKTLLKKGGKDLLKIGKGIVKNPGSAISGIKGAGAAYLAEKGINQLTDRAFKQLRKETRGKNMTLKEYRARKDKAVKEARKKYGIIPTAKKIVNKVRGKSNTNNNLSTNKNIQKQKTNNNKKVTNPKANELKIAKQRVRKAKGYNKEKLQREVRYLEKFGKQGRTWSNPVGAKGNNKPSSVKTDTTTKSPRPGSARAKMIAKNEARFGKARVDKLRKKNQDFQAMKKKKITKAEFIRRYPNSQTAKREKGLR